MCRIMNLSIVLIGMSILIIGCSRGVKNPTEPMDDKIPIAESSSAHKILGLGTITFDRATDSVDVKPIRIANAHTYNSLDYSINSSIPFSLCFSVKDITVSLTNNTSTDYYSVRFIVKINNANSNPPPPINQPININNPDGFTTIYANILGNYDANPFVAFDTLIVNETDSRSVQLICPAGSDSCTYIYAIDAVDSINQSYDPYEISNFSQYVMNIRDTNGNLLNEVSANVQFEVKCGGVDVPSVFVDMINDDFCNQFSVGTPMQLGTSDIWSVDITCIGPVKEHVFNMVVNAVNPGVDSPDPYTNPNSISNVFKLKIGDYEKLVNDMFEPPDANLKADIVDEWESRMNLWGTTPYEVGSQNVEDKDDPDSHYYLLKHTWIDAYGTHNHLGAIRVPPLENIPTGGFPVMLYMHASPGNVSANIGCIKTGICDDPNLDPENATDYYNQFIILFPSYRGNTIEFLTEGWSNYRLETSDGISSIGDYEVDDSLAFLEAFLQYDGVVENGSPNITMQDITNTSKIFVQGGSRGGTPAYLCKIRDKLSQTERLSYIAITCGSPTNFFMKGDTDYGNEDPENWEYLKRECGIYYRLWDNNSNNSNGTTYNGTIGYWREEDTTTGHPYSGDHRFFEDSQLFIHVLSVFQNDMNYTLQDARHRMLLSSPYHFDDSLSEDPIGCMQVNYGNADRTVRPEHSDKLEDLYSDANDHFGFYYYNEDHGLADVPAFWLNLQDFYDEI